MYRYACYMCWLKTPIKNISRSHIFYQVWEKHGLKASGASLTVHLNNFRKQLRSFGIEYDAIKVLSSKEVHFSATVESLPDAINDNPAVSTSGNSALQTSSSVLREILKNSVSQTASVRIKIKTLTIGITLLMIISAVVFSLFKTVFPAKNSAEFSLPYAGWEKAGEINTCNYYFLKNYLDRSFNVKEKIENFIIRNNIKCIYSDMILVSVHDSNATEELRTEPERDFLAFCHAAREGFVCESYYNYNGK